MKKNRINAAQSSARELLGRAAEIAAEEPWSNDLVWDEAMSCLLIAACEMGLEHTMSFRRRAVRHAFEQAIEAIEASRVQMTDGECVVRRLREVEGIYGPTGG